MNRIIFFILLLFSNSLFCQKNSFDWNSIKSKNTFDQNKNDSILVLKYTMKIDSKDTDEVTLYFKLEKINPPLIYIIGSFRTWQIAKYENGNWSYNSINDTNFVFRFTSKAFDPDSNILKSYYFEKIAMLPLFNKLFYKEALTTDIKREGNITIVSQLYLPHKSFKRILYLRDSIIYKIETMPVSDFSGLIYTNLEFKFIHNKSFDQVCKENKLGIYAPYEDLAIKKNIDSLKGVKSNTLAIINKKNLVIDSDSRKYYLLDFWYLGCTPCRLLMPAINKINSLIDSNKIMILGMDPYDNNDEVLKFVKKNSIQYDQVNGRLNNLKYYDVNSFPTLLLIDSKMNVVKEFVGYSDNSERQILRYLKKHKLLKTK